ncbi:MAG: metallophosphoesterase [Firmicutes bacterium]|nr:metallophosphoesterase [Bacillota bacterium]
MNKKYLSLLAGAGLAVTVFAAPINPVFANDYDQTVINSDLNAVSLPDHITLTWSADPAKTMTITWRTNKEVKTCIIEYKEEHGNTTKIEVQPQAFKTAATDNLQGEANLYTITLNQLKPGTKYLYRICDDKNEWTSYSSFVTESKETLVANKFKFIVFGDSQSGNAKVPNYTPFHTTIENAFNANQDAKFFINMGDLVEKGQDYQHWNNWFNATKDVIDKIPDMVVQGNHETYNANDWNSTKPVYFVQQFNVFQNGPDGLKGQTYSYNYGKVHFVVLDSQGEEESEDPQGTVDPAKERAMFETQAEWLKTDLATNKDALFTFVFFHKTPYYNKGNRSNILLKEVFTPVFDQYHVDVVFNGHDHATSRTFPIYHDEFVQSPAQGTVYYVTGRSGAKYYGDLTPKVWDAKFFDPQDQPDYQIVELDGKKLTIKAFKQDGTLVDTYVIDKEHPQNNTSNTENLPSRYNTKQEIPAIGNSLKLILFGNMSNGRTSTATLVNGKAYADINTIAAYAGGTYDADNKVLNIPLAPQKKFQLTDDMLTDNSYLT